MTKFSYMYENLMKKMATKQEIIKIIEISGYYHPVEYPWNSLIFSKKRKETREKCMKRKGKFKNKQDEHLEDMKDYLNLLIFEISFFKKGIHLFSVDDRSIMSSLIISMNNLVNNLEEKEVKDILFYFRKIRENKYIPEIQSVSKKEKNKLISNIINDIRCFIGSLREWCYSSGNKELFK